MSAAPIEKEKLSETTNIDLSEMPDFSEKLPCECNASCGRHQKKCQEEAEVLVKLLPCGCLLPMCPECGYRVKKIVNTIRWIPLMFAACRRHRAFARAIEVIPM